VWGRWSGRGFVRGREGVRVAPLARSCCPSVGAAIAVNSVLDLRYGHVGARIRRDLLDEERAAYGEQIVSTLSAQLVPDYGRGSAAETSAGWWSSQWQWRGLTRRLSRHCRDK
jgi:hypothetical protein